MTLACLIDIVPIAKDIVLATAAIVAMYVGLRGLRTWNRQLKGGVQYELTRRLLKNTYRLRDAIKRVRYSEMWGYEFPAPPAEDAKAMTPDERRHYGLVHAYERRWKEVSEVRNDLRTDLLEAEVMWGKGVHAKFARLFLLQGELQSAVRAHLTASDPKEDEESKAALAHVRRERRNVLFDMGEPDSPDPFTTDVESAISTIEINLKPHLQK